MGVCFYNLAKYNKIMDNVEKFLGRNIKKYRKARNFTQAELADALGIDFKYLSRLETGIASPSIKIIEKMAGVLKINIAQLFEFSEYKDETMLRNELFSKIESYSLDKLGLLSNFLKIIDAN